MVGATEGRLALDYLDQVSPFLSNISRGLMVPQPAPCLYGKGSRAGAPGVGVQYPNAEGCYAALTGAIGP